MQKQQKKNIEAKKEAPKKAPKESAPLKEINIETLEAGTPAAKAIAYLKNILEKLGCEKVSLSASEVENGIQITISGEGLGVVIGHRGETLDSLQYLVSLAANAGVSGYFRVVLNTGDFRQKREQTLIALAKRMSEQAIKSGKCRTLEPMNPYERRIIHTAVQEIDGAISWSEGQGYDRHVVIGPDPAKKNMRKGGNRQGKFRNSRPRNDFSEARVPTEPKAVDSFGDMNVSLYQKIEYKPADESAE